jgi:hypothetical protein
MKIAPTDRSRLVPMAGEASAGFSLLAGLFLAVTGGFHILLALLALTGDSDRVFTTPHYGLEMTVDAWGWIHLVTGVIAAVVGVGILMDRRWAYIVALPVVFVSAVENFAFLPHSPVWSVMMLAFDVVILWALCQELKEFD